jgi:glutamate decarboxylase
MPEHPMDPSTAYEIVHDELALDGNARLNVATFVTTWMEPQARLLIAETLDKNMIDKDEYPQTAALENRCVRMLADLWHSPDALNGVGTSTIGSSEAAMLGGLALKWRWRERMKKAGKPVDRPNLVMGVNVQVCWEKFCRYWDIEPILVPMERGRYFLTAEEAVKHCDENTIGVVAILGSTEDGSYEPVQEIATALDTFERESGVHVPIHVDAASGGFIALFLDPDLLWDFRVPRVQSINTSGHKYGLVYPGVGWILWRDEGAAGGPHLPGQLPRRRNADDGDQLLAPWRSRRRAVLLVLRLGKVGYYEVQKACRDTARSMAEGVAALGPFELISDGSQLPVFMFRLKDDVENYTVYDIADRLRQHGWLVPSYSFPENLQDMDVIRIVIRNGFSRDMGRFLLRDIQQTIDALAKLERPLQRVEDTSTFHH